MCDVFNNFLKFQRQSQEPMHVLTGKRYFGQLFFMRGYVVKDAVCTESVDGSSKVDITFYRQEAFFKQLPLLSLPTLRVRTIETPDSLRDSWTIKFSEPNLHYDKPADFVTLDNNKSRSVDVTMLCIVREQQ
jgi:hypothetical protein